MIDTTGLDNASVLAALFNCAKCGQGIAALSYAWDPLSKDDAQILLDTGQTYFDYLRGRVMKVEIQGDSLDPRLYDRDNGQGAAERAIDSLRQGRR